MNRNIFFIIFLFIASPFFANDGRVVLGKSVEMIDNEDTNIAMLEEVIIISLHDSYYEVDVFFVFFNDGPEETILLGFPIQAITYDNPEERELAKITDFHSYINGELITEYIIKEESYKEKYYSYLYHTQWFIREVTFPENSYTNSRVTYKAPYNMEGFFSTAGYIYGTGRNWKGTIGKITVIINHGDNKKIGDITGDVLFGNYENYRTFDFSWEANGKYKYILENIEPDEKENIKIYVRSIILYDRHGNYYNPFNLTYEGWVWDERLLFKNPTDIKLLTRNQIHLFINYFYAIHGYNFENPLYHKYYQKILSLDNKSTKYWINPNFSYNDFNDIEKENIQYLLYLLNIIPQEDNPVPMDHFLKSIISPELLVDEIIDDNKLVDSEPENNELNAQNNKSLYIKVSIIIIIQFFVGLALILIFVIRKN